MSKKQNLERVHKMSADRENHGGSGLGASFCSHDYHKLVRKGRARYHCRKCDADISLDVILLAEAEMESENRGNDHQPL